MFVPADGMNGESPERKGARSLVRLFTFVAIRIVQVRELFVKPRLLQTPQRQPAGAIDALREVAAIQAAAARQAERVSSRAPDALVGPQLRSSPQVRCPAGARAAVP